MTTTRLCGKRNWSKAKCPFQWYTQAPAPTEWYDATLHMCGLDASHDGPHNCGGCHLRRDQDQA